MRETFIWRDGKLIPKDQAPPPPSRKVHGAMPDIQPFQSPIDGSVISSRPHLAAHNRRHGVIDTGDDKTVLQKRKPYEPQGLVEDIRRALGDG